MPVYSKRDRPVPDTLRYDIPELARSRILAGFNFQLENEWAGTQREINVLLETIFTMAMVEYGGLREGNSYARSKAEQVTQHFFACTDDEALDFIEWCFRFNEKLRELVGFVNKVFREEGIGYAFTPSNEGTERLPEAIKTSNNLIQQTTVMPCLSLLNSPVFQTANSEMLEAHEHFRHGRYEDANTACGRSFETVFKTICETKGWPYDKDKDTLVKLVDICRDQGLFPGFYVEIFKASGMVRNKLGGHGKGPTPQYTIDPEHVDHMIQMTSAHILLLAHLAEIT